MSHQEAQLEIQGMHCTGCAANIEHYLRRLKGVTRAKVDFKTGHAMIAIDSTIVTLNQILSSSIFREPSNFTARVLQPGDASATR